MIEETFPKRPETGERDANPWSVRVKNLAVNNGKFNSDTDTHSLESHDVDGTHYVLGYKPHTKLAMEPECLAISTGNNPNGSKRQLRFVWEESAGPDTQYATQLNEIDKIIKVFESPKGTDA